MTVTIKMQIQQPWVGIRGWDIKSHLALRGVVFPRADGKG